MKGNKHIATFLPYPLQHDQHYDDIMFIFQLHRHFYKYQHIF